MINGKYKYLKPFNNVQKISSGSFKDVVNKICLYLIYMYKQDLALNNL